MQLAEIKRREVILSEGVYINFYNEERSVTVLTKKGTVEELLSEASDLRRRAQKLIERADFLETAVRSNHVS